MRLVFGKFKFTIPENIIAGLFMLYTSWMTWVTKSLYDQRQDIAVIRERIVAATTKPLIKTMGKRKAPVTHAKNGKCFREIGRLASSECGSALGRR